MGQNCGNLTVNVNCDSQDNTAIMDATNSGESMAEIILDIPEGAKIVDPNGNVLFTQDGEPDKCKIKIPGA